ncbi:unnamed protein product [Sphagnum troendelagicum]|uniref:c-Myc-binding protein n=1 Tax=Sphagnum troendelagicum TaxID=128251 RepID=A0ABP0TQZ5_9BRYO
MGMKGTVGGELKRWMGGGSGGSESKKEAFRKYLEASGVLDALTKVLVALYEEHDKPAIALEFIRHALGGPTIAEHDNLKKDIVELQAKYDLLLSQHEECCRQLQLLQPPTEDATIPPPSAATPPKP